MVEGIKKGMGVRRGTNLRKKQCMVEGMKEGRDKRRRVRRGVNIGKKSYMKEGLKEGNKRSRIRRGKYKKEVIYEEGDKRRNG